MAPRKKVPSVDAGAAATPAPQPAKAGKPKRVYFSQGEFPQESLQEAERVAAAIMDNYAGQGASPPDVALAVGVSPSSSTWRVLSGSAIAYGLTDGGPNADRISLTALGRQLVAPEEEGQDLAARREAILQPRIMREFFEKYRRAKFPSDTTGKNVLRSMGVPDDRLDQALKTLFENGQYSGVIRDTPTGPYVNLDSPGVPLPAATSTPDAEPGEGHPEPRETEPAPVAPPAPPTAKEAFAVTAASRRVFVSHGKQRAIANQIKELLGFGQFEPVVSVERESTAIPVPEKVFEDMRSCSAGVVHVTPEGEYLDREGKQHSKINDNVLIEIGAAMALYGKRVVLLVEKGLDIPSNLQGLYRCEYEGDQLDYEATMKLLKTFAQFRQ